MVRKSGIANPAISIVLPASNEAGLIGPCLKAILASNWTCEAGLEVIVVANGCRDDTAQRATEMRPAFEGRGWSLIVLDLEEGGKLNALNAGDAVARAGSRVYLDADVTVSADLMAQLESVLSVEAPRYASGRVNITAPDNWVSRAYARIYRKVPFMASGVPGCGVFAVNAAGRARWDTYPSIISDDTFVRLTFTPQERVGVAASYDWPIVSGLRNLIRVRRRQNEGVDEIRRLFPHLLDNDDDRPFPAHRKVRMAAADPVGFAVYSGVALIVKLFPASSQAWSRGR